MERIDPLEFLKNKEAILLRRNRSDASETLASEPLAEDEMIKITVRLPLKVSNELKKMAIDQRIPRDRILLLLIRQLQTDSDLFQKIVSLAKRLPPS
jgi:hypothetical protein